MSIEKLLQGHQHYVNTFARAESDYLRELAEAGQSPDTLMISCSDSRVIPELITGASPGHLFVVRNIANLVPPLKANNMSVGAAIDYALNVLGVGHIVVLGHYGCGGMAALRDLFGPGGARETHTLKDSPLTTWLQYAEGSYDEAVHKGALDTDEWLNTLVEENVLQQLSHILEYPHVRDAAERGALRLHGWTYSLDEASLYFFDAKLRAFVSGDEAAARAATGELSVAEIGREDEAH